MRYFVSYTGTLDERRAYGYGIIDMTNKLKTKEDFEELKKHIEVKDNLSDVVILNFKEINQEEIREPNQGETVLKGG